MKEIKVKVYWNEDNYECGWAMDGVGCVVATDKTLDGVKVAFAEALSGHLAGMLSDGEVLPMWLASEEYSIIYELEVSAILRNAEQYTTMAALSRVSGINQKQLSHYANSVKKPRREQRQRIIDALHTIGETFLAIC